MPTSYHCIALQIATDSFESDLAQLYENACLGLIEESRTSEWVRVKAYFPDDVSLKDRMAQLQVLMDGLLSIEGTIIALSSDDFKQASFDPFLLTPNLWVMPPPDLSSAVDIAQDQGIIIRPGMAFGTGRHETTQLVAAAIERLPSHARSLLDVGTGSGILAIQARRQGIAHVDAVEISEDARRNAQGNFELNELEGIGLFTAIQEISGTYEVVVANILTPTILNLKDELLRVMKPEGRLILSGITSDECSEIEKTFSALPLEDKTEKNEWCCYIYK